MSKKEKAAKPAIDITRTDELGLTDKGQKVSIAAWVLSGLVIVAGIIALVATGQRIFILFIVLGILTPLNVLAYDNLILKPKVARLKKERAAEAAEQQRAAEADAEADPQTAPGSEEVDQ